MAPRIERGWSSSPHRKLKRYFAKRLPTRTIMLPPDRTVASLTFDDVPDSAAAFGAPILEKHAVRGTFYVSAAMCGVQDTHWKVATRRQVRDLHRAGHEVACHTANHVNVQSLGRDALMTECDVNSAMLQEICGEDLALTNFAYPFGDLGLRQRILLEKRFASCRTIYEFFNAGRISLGRVGAIGLFDATKDRRGLRKLLDDARTRGGWLVFYTHDVDATPTFMGTSPGLLDDTLTMLADAGIPVMTMRTALDAFLQARPSNGNERCAIMPGAVSLWSGIVSRKPRP